MAVLNNANSQCCGTPVGILSGGQQYCRGCSAFWPETVELEPFEEEEEDSGP